MTDGVDPVTNIVLQELRSFRLEMNDRLDKLVTTESFRQEQTRVNERFAEFAADLQEERRQREVAADAERRRQADIEQEQEKARRDKKWLIATALAPLAFMLVQWFLDQQSAAQIAGGG